MPPSDPTIAGPPVAPQDEAVGADGRTLAPGAIVGEYRIVAAIASGGCGTVYSAEHLVLGRRVAVKVLHPELSGHALMVQRFMREARVVNQIRHPNVVDIFGFGELRDRRPYFVMELLDGTTLGSLVRHSGPLSPAQAVAYLKPVCAALHAAHRAGVVHRDLKPSNIAVAFGEELAPLVKLLDFGIAKLLRPDPGEPGLTVAGQRLGTPSAMAPEQILGRPVDARVDIYALGVLLYFCLTGHYPFEAEDPLDVERMHLEAPPPRPSKSVPVPSALDDVVLRCMEKRAEKRYPSVPAFVEALTAAVGIPGAPAAVSNASLSIGIYLEAELPQGAELDALSQLDEALERAQADLTAAKLQLGLQTSNALLGVQVLPPEPEAALAARRAVIDLASALLDAIQPTDFPPPYRVRCTVHAGYGEVRPTPEGPQVTGGEILRVEGWPQDRSSDLFVSPQAAQGLDRSKV